MAQRDSIFVLILFIGFDLFVSVGVVAQICAPTQIRTTTRDFWSPLIELRNDQGDYISPLHAILLPNGKVLAMGIARKDLTVCGLESGLSFLLDVAQLDSRPQSIPESPDPLYPEDMLYCSGHALLPDGRVLAAGGMRITNHVYGLPYARILANPHPKAWTRVTTPMSGGSRWYPTVTALEDGQMLVGSGWFDLSAYPAPGPFNLSWERFDPSAYDRGDPPWSLLVGDQDVQRWRELGSMYTDYTQTFLLPTPIFGDDGLERQVALYGRTGRVFLFNHQHDWPGEPEARFTSKPNSLRPGFPGDLAASAASGVLVSRRIVIAGGGGERTQSPLVNIYDPYQDQWNCMDMEISRSFTTTTILPDASVLIMSGYDNSGESRRPQIIDPISRTVTNGQPWSRGEMRGYHNVALLLPDGRVLVAGGALIDYEPGCEQPTYQLYSPEYLSYPEARPSIVSAESQMTRGVPYSVSYDNGGVDRVVIVALGSMTHSIDMNQRHHQFKFSATNRVSGTFSIDWFPTNFEAPDGYYMLFLLRRHNDIYVPSKAEIIRLVTPSP